MDISSPYVDRYNIRYGLGRKPGKARFKACTGHRGWSLKKERKMGFYGLSQVWSGLIMVTVREVWAGTVW